jgi:hypothetical protein
MQNNQEEDRDYILLEVDHMQQFDEDIRNSLKQSSIKPFPPLHVERKFHILAFTSAPKTDIQHLEQLPVGHARMNWVRSSNFTNRLKDTHFLKFSKKKKYCVLPSELHDKLPVALEKLHFHLPKSTILWTKLFLTDSGMKQKLRSFVEKGFTNPYVTNRCPISKKDKSKYVALSRSNKPNVEIHIDKALNKFDYALKQHDHIISQNTVIPTCYVIARFSAEALAFLKQAPFSGMVEEKDGSKSQREMTGELFVEQVEKNAEKEPVYVIGVRKTSIELGEKEAVNVSPTRYNFHSHPHEAYVRHSVHKAWPSVTDFKGLLTLGKNTIFHCVAAIEGFYIVNLTPYGASILQNKKQRKKLTKFVDTHFEIDQNKSWKPEEFCQKLNTEQTFKFRDDFIYHLQYFKWDQGLQPFKVSYPAFGNYSCLATECMKQTYEAVHDDDEDDL